MNKGESLENKKKISGVGGSLFGSLDWPCIGCLGSFSFLGGAKGQNFDGKTVANS